MKINNYNNQYLKTNTSIPKEEKPKNIETKVEKSANVQISNSAKELVKGIEGSKEVSFSAKVEQIRKSISEGSYKVSPENIADKILQVIEGQKGSDL